MPASRGEGRCVFEDALIEVGRVLGVLVRQQGRTEEFVLAVGKQSFVGLILLYSGC